MKIEEPEFLAANILKEGMILGENQQQKETLLFLDSKLKDLRKTVFTMKYNAYNKWCIYKHGEPYIEVNSPYVSVVNMVMSAYEDSYRAGKSEIIGDMVDFIKEK